MQIRTDNSHHGLLKQLTVYQQHNAEDLSHHARHLSKISCCKNIIFQQSPDLAKLWQAEVTALERKFNFSCSSGFGTRSRGDGESGSLLGAVLEQEQVEQLTLGFVTYEFVWLPQLSSAIALHKKVNEAVKLHGRPY